MEPNRAQTSQSQEDFRHIVRIANTDLLGDKPLRTALKKIKGVGFMFSNLICSISGIDSNKIVGSLNDGEIRKLDEIIRDPSKFGAPIWMFNRRKDPEDGSNKHLLSSDLVFVHDNDIKLMKKIKCYKGIRHSLGQPVRGQRTKSNFRKNKGKVHLGVMRKEGTKAGKV